MVDRYHDSRCTKFIHTSKITTTRDRERTINRKIFRNNKLRKILCPLRIFLSQIAQILGSSQLADLGTRRTGKKRRLNCNRFKNK